MREGTKIEVSSGHGSFICFFISWEGNTDKFKAINKFGGIIIADQKDVLEFFI